MDAVAFDGKPSLVVVHLFHAATGPSNTGWDGDVDTVEYPREVGNVQVVRTEGGKVDIGG